MTLDNYQKKSRFSIIHPELVSDLKYLGLALAGETGEIAEKIKKLFRDDGGKITRENKEQIIKEMGDVLWYFARIADALGVSLSHVAKSSLEKIISRKNRGKIHGSGDNR